MDFSSGVSWLSWASLSEVPQSSQPWVQGHREFTVHTCCSEVCFFIRDFQKKKTFSSTDKALCAEECLLWVPSASFFASKCGYLSSFKRYGFRKPPYIELKARPKLGERSDFSSCDRLDREETEQEFQVHLLGHLVHSRCV